MNQLRVGKLRQQCALQSADTPVYAKIGDHWVQVMDAWPDTQMAARGHGLYLELDAKELEGAVYVRNKEK